MSFIADAHVHIYPEFDLDNLIETGHNKLKSFGQANSYLFFIVEPHSQFEFANIVKRVSSNIQVSPTEDSNVLKINTKYANDLYLIAGRQIVSKERLEFLMLFCRKDIPNGLSIDELLILAKKYSSILVLNWAPGKWMFERSKVVRELLEKVTPKDLLICDTALRFLPEPELMKLAREKGYKIIFGSDPFPFVGEERRVGEYAMFCNGETSFKDALLNGQIQPLGKRLSAFNALRCVFRLMLKKKLK